LAWGNLFLQSENFAHHSHSKNVSGKMNSPSGLRIVFFGTPEFAAHILRYLIEHGENIVGIVTTPDKPHGRGLKMKSSAVKETAAEFHLPVLTPSKHRDPDFLDALDSLRGEVFVVAAYKILPKEVFTIPRLGSFNIHASILPKYRGAAPINWAIIRGESETGITTFLLDEKVDTGLILLSKSLPIGIDETAGELHDRLMHLGAECALETLSGLANGTLDPVKQPTELATPAPKIFPKNCIIDFDKPREEVHNFIRGMSPHPGAVTTLKDGLHLKILRSKLSLDAPNGLTSGKFLVTDSKKRLFAGTATGAIEILEVQREGKRAMPTEEFLRGAKWLSGTHNS
jgi:methionyl-tRNA formyltransferase